MGYQGLLCGLSCHGMSDGLGIGSLPNGDLHCFGFRLPSPMENILSRRTGLKGILEVFWCLILQKEMKIQRNHNRYLIELILSIWALPPSITSFELKIQYMISNQLIF